MKGKKFKAFKLEGSGEDGATEGTNFDDCGFWHIWPIYFTTAVFLVEIERNNQ